MFHVFADEGIALDDADGLVNNNGLKPRGRNTQNMGLSYNPMAVWPCVTIAAASRLNCPPGLFIPYSEAYHLSDLAGC